MAFGASPLNTDHKLLPSAFQTNAYFLYCVHIPVEHSNMFWRLSCLRRAPLPMRSQQGAHFWRALMKGFELILCCSWTPKYIRLDSSSNRNFQDTVTARDAPGAVRDLTDGISPEPKPDSARGHPLGVNTTPICSSQQHHNRAGRVDLCPAAVFSSALHAEMLDIRQQSTRGS